MSWPLKYRPRTFEELALRDVRQQLQKLLSSPNAPQVFLFAGPKGSGKTSTSRIISSFLNQELDEQEKEKIFSGSSFTVQEMDAASNRGIDDIRLLKERVVMPPQLGKKSVYILDEAHMLTKEAFNALLKLLEEPPEHAVFILATTELQKIPDTIISRANLVKFRQATADELFEVLEKILTKESIEFDKEALNNVVARADGSFRDAVKLLEMVCRGEKRLTSASLEVLGSLTLQDDIRLLLGAVVAKEELKVIEVIEGFRKQGEDEKYVTKSLLEFLHQDLLSGLGVSGGTAIFAPKVDLFLLDNLVALPPTPSPISFLNLEVKLLDIIFKAKDRAGASNSGAPVKTVFKPELIKKNPIATKIEAKTEVEAKFEPAVEEVADIVRANTLVPSPLKDFVSDNLVEPEAEEYVNLQAVWGEFLKAIENQNLTLAAIMKSGKLLPDANGRSRIGVYYKFHKLQLEQQRQLSVLQNCAREVAGAIPKFEFVLLDQVAKSAPDQVQSHATSNNGAVVQSVKPADKSADEGLESAISEALL